MAIKPKEIIKTKSGRKTYLTDKEFEILKELMKGLFNNEVADNLSLSIRTVENHRFKITQKLECRNAIELTKLAIKLGIVKV